jgi:hypothetical protein
MGRKQMKKLITTIAFVIALSGQACPGGYRESDCVINQLEEN